MTESRGTLIQGWRTAWSVPFVVEGILSIFVMVGVLVFLAHFLDSVEMRAGFAFADPVLVWFDAVDVTWLTFTLIYGALAGTVGALLWEPKRLWQGLQAYSCLLLWRALAMWMLPLDPPVGMILLKDPVIEFFGSNGVTLTRDLFFSGHTSTMFLLTLVMPRPRLRPWMFLATAGVAACVLLQKVHYTIDVLCAPFFAYGAYRMIRIVREKFGLN